jgi:L-ascorbate metabolism protein UlaG (beta-lactamase superfamily)
MPLRFTVLASGSSGNASLLQTDTTGVMIDAGFGPRRLASRLAAVGAGWQHVHAVLLTHIHSDHWNTRTFAHLLRHRIKLFVHPSHQQSLRTTSPAFAKLEAGNLVHLYQAEGEFAVAAGLRCRALPIAHDGGPTFGFRFESEQSPGLHPLALAYLADLGSWTPSLAHAIANVDILALEFNHDIDMEYTSGRSAQLIARVLGDEGHLSNDQAAGLLADIIDRSEAGRLKHVIQLHLSRNCNHVELAVRAAQIALDGRGLGISLHTAQQHCPGPILTIGAAAWTGSPARSSEGRPPSRRPRPSRQVLLPGWEA